MKRTLIFLLFLLIGIMVPVKSAQAVPANPEPFTITQPDGTEITAYVRGDEWLHWTETDEGYTVLLDADGWWVYAQQAADGSLGVSLDGINPRLIAGVDDPNGLPQHLHEPYFNPREEKIAELTQSDAISLDGISLDSPYLKFTTPQPTLIIPLRFTNTAGNFGNIDPLYFQSLVFGPTSSNKFVADFYTQASFDKLNLVKAAETCGTANDGVTPWISINQPHPGTDPALENAVIAEAISKIDSCVQFNVFDTNQNNILSANELHLIFIAEGYEASYGSSPSYPAVWGHQGWFRTNAPIADGKKIASFAEWGTYILVGEYHYDHPLTMGILAHEFGHDLLWPDEYDTQPLDQDTDTFVIGERVGGIGNWSLMDGGSWNRVLGEFPGATPAFPDAWLKYYQGWINPLNYYAKSEIVKIARAEDNPITLLLYPNLNGVDWSLDYKPGTGEYFLMENRQKVLYDAGLPGCGILIYHIDETRPNTNDANATWNRPLIALEQADGLNELSVYSGPDWRGDSSDPYHGVPRQNAFTNTTTPNSRLYSGAVTNITVENVGACGTPMSAALNMNWPRLFLPVTLNQ